MAKKIPTPDGNLSLKALCAIIQQRSVLAGLEVFHEALGPVFRINLPNFRPVMLAGAEANRWILVEARHDLLWKAPKDPIARLLRDGLLVADGEIHDTMRRHMNPALHRQALGGYVEAMQRCTDRVIDAWEPGETRDMLVEMRRIALLIIMETMFRVDFMPEIDGLWRALLKMVQYISPGLWMLWQDIPRPGYARHLRRIDDYLRHIIRLRRALPQQPDDLLGMLIELPDVDDEMIRDQMLTMIVAGHDTSAGLLSWAMYMLGARPDVLRRAREEVDAALCGEPPALETVGKLRYLERLCDETMRLYPPAHLGSRIAARDLEFDGYPIPAGTRVTYSIYVTHRMKAYWENPQVFDPDRFLPERSKNRPAYSFVPFGGGPRNCIGAAFAQIEARVILARVLQRCDFRLLRRDVHQHMAVTIEPRPGVLMHVRPRA